MVTNSQTKPEDSSSPENPGGNPSSVSADEPTSTAEPETPSTPEKVLDPDPADSSAKPEVGSLSEDQLSSLLSEEEDEVDDVGDLSPNEASEPVPSKSEKPEEASPTVKEPELAQPVLSQQKPKEPEPTPTAKPSVQEPELSQEQIAERAKKARADVESALEKVYADAFSKEDADTLLVSPEKIIPKLAARIHLQAYESVANNLAAHLPQMIANVQRGIDAQREAQENFFGKFPKLKEHSDVAVRFINAYKQANPTASFDEVIDGAGVAAMVHLRLPIDGVNVPQQPQQPQQPPFPPAPKGTGNVPSGTRPSNVFTQLAEEMLLDDSDG